MARNAKLSPWGAVTIVTKGCDAGHLEKPWPILVFPNKNRRFHHGNVFLPEMNVLLPLQKTTGQLSSIRAVTCSERGLGGYS